jgi:phytoene synthase
VRPSRAAIVATAGETIARGSRSFAAATRLLDRGTRERAWLLYAWCHACDSLADGQQGGTADSNARMAAIRERTEAALAGKWIGDPAFDALRIVVAEAEIPHRLVWDMVEGFALEAADWQPRHEEDLYLYCYHVAGAAGCMIAVAMGARPGDAALLDCASDLGIGFQLANIARNIAEDDRAGHCYLPADWLAEMDMPPGEELKPPYRPRLAVLAARLADRAEAYIASGRAGAAALPFRPAWAALAAAGIYGAVAAKVRAAGEHAWDHRIATSAVEKLGWIARGFGEALQRRQFVSQKRDELWTRPHD